MGFVMPLIGMMGAGGAAAGAGGSMLGMIGTGLSAFGSIMGGIAEKKNAKYQAAISMGKAKMATENANLEGQKGEMAAAREGARTKAAVAAMTTKQGASGVDVGSGSAVDVRAGRALVGQEDTLNIKANAARSAYGYQTEAAGHVAQASAHKAAGKNAMLGGILGGVSTVLGGIGSQAKNPYTQAMTSGSFATPVNAYGGGYTNTSAGRIDWFKNS